MDEKFRNRIPFPPTKKCGGPEPITSIVPRMSMVPASPAQVFLFKATRMIFQLHASMPISKNPFSSIKLFAGTGCTGGERLCLVDICAYWQEGEKAQNTLLKGM